MTDRLQYQVLRSLSDEVLEQVFLLESQIFEKPYSIEKLKREASRKQGLVAVLCYAKDNPVGYKIGYELSSRLYYSWIGGVLPEMRGKGIARKLLELQHDEIKTMGYSCVRTYTENKYREMLILNIKSGFDVIGVYKSDHDEKQKIMLEKML